MEKQTKDQIPHFESTIDMPAIRKMAFLYLNSFRSPAIEPVKVKKIILEVVGEDGYGKRLELNIYEGE